MRLRHHRDDDERTDVDSNEDADRYEHREPVETERARSGDDAAGREEVVETSTTRWDLGSVLATAVGVALIVIGVLALMRTGVNSTWYDPVENVAGLSHTPLLGAIEVGVGALLVLAGLAGARMFAALVALVAGVAALIVAIEPSLADRELAIDRGWAIALAIGGLTLAFVLILSRERHHERRIERRSVQTA